MFRKPQHRALRSCSLLFVMLFAVFGATVSVHAASIPAPTITGFSRYSDSINGGATITITGTNFASGARVLFGETAATSSTAKSATELTAIVPPHLEGRVKIVVANPDGQSATTTADFIFVRPGFANYAFAQTWYAADLAVLRGKSTSSWLYGPQTYQGQAEIYAEAPNGLRLVQYFDKARMEYTERSDNLNAVTAGLLTDELVSGRRQEGDAVFVNGTPAQIPVAGDPDDSNGPTYASFTNIATVPGTPRPVAQNGNYIAQSITRDGQVVPFTQTPPVAARNAYYIRETGHNIPDVFINWLNARGNWVATMGFPIAEAYWAQVKVGGVPKTVLMQLFERRVLTFTASNSPQYQVEYGNIGLHYYTWRYGTQPVASPFPAPRNVDGIWRGTTNQGRKVFFTVENNSASTMLYTFDGANNCQNFFFSSIFAKSHPILENTYNVIINSTKGTQADVTVNFGSETAAAGTIKHTSGSDFAGCGNLNLTFTATKDAPADEALDGLWAGKTAQGDPISVAVAHHTVRSVSFPFHKIGCAPDTANYYFLDYYNPNNIGSGGAFSLVFNPTNGLTFTLNGQFGTTLNGTLKTAVVPPPGYTFGCDGTQTVQFSATKQAPTSSQSVTGFAYGKDEMALSRQVWDSPLRLDASQSHD